MQLLITGGNGQVGWELAQCAAPPEYTIHALTRAQLDITNPQQVDVAIAEYKPDVVINTAAYTAVDKAEQEIEQAFAINRDGAKVLAEACTKAQLPLIHLSTDYVFDGKQQQPYREQDAVAPINQYGASKWAGEEAVRAACEQHIILRVSGVFSSHGNNFVKTILRLAQERETLRIVADQTICPTPAADIAQVILMISKQIINNKKIWGTYHYCSAEPTSWHYFAENIVSLAKQYKPLKVQEIQAITTEEFPTPAQRPRYSVLDCSKLQKNFNIPQRPWHAGLAEVIKILMK